MSGAVSFDGGPAFPAPGVMGLGTLPGASLRDYFAAAALTGILSDIESLRMLAEAMKELEGSADALAAAMSYEYADAMLAARGRGVE
jgi:hypothetical protein